MSVSFGWLLLASLQLPVSSARAPLAPERTPGRIAIWSDREDPYSQGEPVRVYLHVEAPSYLAVFRLDTDGRLQVLFPHDPWADSYVVDDEKRRATVDRPAQEFIVDDDPGIGYLFAVASSSPLDFREITRGDYWDFRLVDGGRVQRDPYVSLTDLAAHLAPDGDYDYDITPYYVDHRYDFPRFVCYECHSSASYDEWNPYQTTSPRYHLIVRDDPRYYPYRYGGRNVVVDRPAHPGPRYVFREAAPPTRSSAARGAAARLGAEAADRPPAAGEDVGGRAVAPAALRAPMRQRERKDTTTHPPPRSTGEPQLRRRTP
jgi:hypothetical protein